MVDFNHLYQKLLKLDYKDFYEFETEFFLGLYNAFSENQLPWITAFLTISTWAGISQRSGVWTFYEVRNVQEMKTVVRYLRMSGDNELADIFEKGIHDYQNPQYAKKCDYPEEWLEEAEEIDLWISEHEDWLWKWEYNILVVNRKSIGVEMLYFDLKSKLNEYNWDDGFEVPREILADPECDLALALEVFYLGDGYSYLENLTKTTDLKEWERFIATLYDDILNNKFPKTSIAFKIPLTRVQKYKLRKNGVPEIFLNDL